MPKVYYIIIRFVNYKAKLQELKPLEFFEEVLVYDTFQWEDEFNHNHHNAHSDDHKKQSIDEEPTDKILSGHEKVANFSDKRKLFKLLLKNILLYHSFNCYFSRF